MRTKGKIFASQILIKIFVSMLIITLTSSNFLFCGTYFVCYAVDLIQEKNGELDKQTDATLSKNVKFDAYFRNENSKTHYKVADVNNDEVNIDLKLDVQKEGYLKDIVISMQPKDESTILNYQLNKIKDEEMLVKKQSENNIYLQQLNKEESANISLSIVPNINEQTTKSILNQNSIIKLTGTYINDNGEESNIEKDVTLNIGWTGKYEVKNDIEIAKYLPVNINNEGKVFLQLNIKTGLEEKTNTLPIKNTKIELSIPTFNNIEPEKIDLSAKSTQATNGLKDEKVVFSNDNWTKKDNKITININNEENEGMIQNGKGLDEYLVTFVYPKEAYDSIKDEEIALNTQIKTAITIYSNKDEETFTNEKNETLKLKEEIGKLLSFEGNTKTDKIGKGKMYANLNSQTKENETLYETSWNINVGYKDSLDSIILKDTSDEVANAFGSKIDISKYVTYKSTVVSKTSFMQILGEDGRINIKDAEGKLVAFINKLTNQDENGDYIINYYGNVNNLQIETSAPIAEGNLVINNTKAITGNLQLTKTEIEDLSNLISTYGLWQKEKESNKNIQTEEKFVSIPFEETSSKAKLTINKEKFSTLIKNENVEFKIELGNNNDSSDLYVDPMFDIEFPSYIEDIDIKDSKILYDDELVIKSIEKMTNANGNLVIRIQLSGVQTKFSNGTVTNGTNIILNTDVKVSILTPSIDDNINMYYYNINNSNYENTIETEYGKAGIVKTAISYAAPLGLINVSNWSNFDKTRKTNYVCKSRKYYRTNPSIPISCN